MDIHLTNKNKIPFEYKTMPEKESGRKAQDAGSYVKDKIESDEDHGALQTKWVGYRSLEIISLACE